VCHKGNPSQPTSRSGHRSHDHRKVKLRDLERLPTPLNDGEREVLNALLLLDDGWEIFVQPRLALIQPDFVLLHKHAGVHAVEVKDWKPSAYRPADNGIEVRDGGRWLRLPETPVDQGKRYRSIIFDRFFALPDTKYAEKQAVHATVVLPRFTEPEARTLLSSRGGVQVAGSDMSALVQRIAADEQHAQRRPDDTSLSRLRRHLRESEFTSDQRQPLRLSRGAKNLASNPEKATIRRARGPAGCGKSLGLAARAVTLAGEGKQVLVLSFNITLAHYLHDLCSRRGREVGLGPASRNITFSHFHAFCEDVVTQYSDERLAFSEDHLQRIVRAVHDLYSRGGSSAPQYDAVLVDEGQDFHLEWWNLLRHSVLRDGGEMLLVADRTQDIYETAGWTGEESMAGAGFRGRWTDLSGTYRMPPDLVPIVAEFARRHVPVEHRDVPTLEMDHPLLADAYPQTVRSWINTSEGDLAQEAADSVERLLDEYPSLHPDDLVVLADHSRGGEVMAELRRHGHEVSHIFTPPGSDHASQMQRRKRRFWGGTPGIKGCTIDSFKGWEARAVIAVPPAHDVTNRRAYIAMTRVKGDPSRAAFVTVVNTRVDLDSFKSQFERTVGPDEVPSLGGQGALEL